MGSTPLNESVPVIKMQKSTQKMNGKPLQNPANPSQVFMVKLMTIAIVDNLCHPGHDNNNPNFIETVGRIRFIGQLDGLYSFYFFWSPCIHAAFRSDVLLRYTAYPLCHPKFDVATFYARTYIFIA